jgi:hypothetical protein
MCKHIRLEGREACVLSDAGEMGQQQGGNAASAIRLCNDKSDLGAFRLLPFRRSIAAISDLSFSRPITNRRTRKIG